MADDDREQARTSIGYKIYDIQVALERKSATVILEANQHPGCMVHLNSFPFDPPGDQTESELRKLALQEAKEILKDAAKAL